MREKRRVKVMIENVSGRKAVVAYPSSTKGLCFHPAYPDVSGCWNITHKRSGLAIFPDLPTKREAQMLAMKLGRVGIDWTQSAHDVRVQAVAIGFSRATFEGGKYNRPMQAPCDDGHPALRR